MNHVKKERNKSLTFPYFCTNYLMSPNGAHLFLGTELIDREVPSTAQDGLRKDGHVANGQIRHAIFDTGCKLYVKGGEDETNSGFRFYQYC